MCIQEEKIINTFGNIEKAEIKCTFSNGQTINFEAPTIDGNIIITADVLEPEYISVFDSYDYCSKYMNYKMTMVLPLYCDQDGVILKLKEI